MTMLPSAQVILAAPLSWTGSTQRIWRRWHPPAQAATGWAKTGRETALWSMLAGAWIGVLLWYALLIFCGLIPIIALISYRIVRRNGRKRQMQQLRHEETLAALRR